MLTLFKAYGFVKEENNKFFLTETAKDYLTGESDFDLSSYVGSLKTRPICIDMKKVLQTGKPANWAANKKGKDWVSSMENNNFAESFTKGMNSRGAYLANGILKVINFNNYKRILDIGGGSGIYSAIFLKNNLSLYASIFEKPPVDKVANYSINKFNIADRIDIIAGDMFKDDFPLDHDIHLLSHVLHDWDLNEVKTIVKKSFQSLSSRGIIVIHDAHINETKTGPLSVAEYSVLLMFLSEGKCYSIKEMKDLLQETGFESIEYKSTILNRSVIIGKKPG